MVKHTIVLVAALAVMAPAVLAQTSPIANPAFDRQRATTHELAMMSPHGFIYDEFGNVYDERGQLIAPRPLRR
ncbi:MAG: hypothetical protein KIT25_11190 [Enhydrobacter sp.]|nr:MAG: hypothetical protein KIT25_11190 [Enhydrobacter sp.]